MLKVTPYSQKRHWAPQDVEQTSLEKLYDELPRENLWRSVELLTILSYRCRTLPKKPGNTRSITFLGSCRDDHPGRGARSLQPRPGDPTGSGNSPEAFA